MPARRSYGTGSLFVRPDSTGRDIWYGQWRQNGRQTKRRLGRKRGEGEREGLTRRQAEAELRRLTEASNVPARPRGEALTVAELGQRYRRYLAERGRKKATLVGVESALRVWLEPFFAERSIDAITTQDVSDLMALMRSRDVGSKSIRNYVGTLSALFNYAEKKRWASRNPVREIELPAIERNEDVRFLERHEVDALVAAAVEGPYQAVDRTLYLTAAMTGLRQGELIALRWRDVDWKAARVRVRQNYVLGEFGTPKSKRSTRSVPLADVVAGELDRLFTASGSPEDDALVFADPHTSGPLSKAAILRRYKRALRGARLDPAHVFHGLRHTFGTAMAGAGVPMRTLQEWMGHRDIETTQRYADYAPSTQEASYVEAAFGRSTPLGTNPGTNLSESHSI